MSKGHNDTPAMVSVFQTTLWVDIPCKTTKTTKMDIWRSTISTTFIDSPQVWTKLVSVPDPKPTPVQIAFSILKAIYVLDDETRMKTALGLGTVVLSPDPTYESESGDIRLIPWASRWLLSGEKLLSANHIAENTVCSATLQVLGYFSTINDTALFLTRNLAIDQSSTMHTASYEF